MNNHMMGFDLDDDVFPDRKDIKKKSIEKSDFYDDIVKEASKIDVNKVDFSNEDFKPRSEITQKQKVFFWVRVYLREEMNIEPMTNIHIIWKETNEKLTTKFICYAKKGLDKDLEEQVTNYNPEDDKKVLCLMIDEDRINIHNDDIPFLKTLFKIGRHYQYQVWQRQNMVLVNDSDVEMPWFDIDF